MNSLVTKIGLCFTLLIIFSTGATGLYSHFQNRDLLLNYISSSLAFEADLHVKSIIESISDTEKSLLFLANTPSIQGIARSIHHYGIDPIDQSSLHQWRERLENTFRHMMKQHEEYAKIHFIGGTERMHELVRVNKYPDGTITRTPLSELRDKHDQEYVQQALLLRPGQIYTSRISLAQEYGKISKPHMPTIRLVTPIDYRGKLFGVVVINLDLRTYLTEFSSTFPQGTQTYLVDEQGMFLAHPDPSKTFGADLGRDIRLQTAIPEAWELLTKRQPDDIRLKKSDANTERTMLFSGWFHLGTAPSQRKIGAVIEFKNYELFKGVDKSRDSVVIFTILAMTVSILLTWLLSRRITKPLRTLSQAMLAYGSFGELSNLPAESKDEIGDISRSFKTMCREIKEHTIELQKLTSRFETLIDIAPVGILETDIAGNCIRVNKAWQKFAGKSTAEALGQGWINAVHPEDRHMVSNEWKSTIQGKQDFNLQYRFIKNEGAVTWVLGSVAPNKDTSGQQHGYICIVQDITEIRQAQAKLRESEKIYRMHFENANDAIFILENQNIIDCNPMGMALHRADSIDTMRTKTWVDISAPSQADGTPSEVTAQYYIEKAMAGTPQRFEWIGQTFDNILIDLEVTLNRLDVQDKPLLITIARDITAHKEYENALILNNETESTFAALAKSLVTCKKLSEISDLILEFGLKVTESNDGFIGYTDNDNGEFLVPVMSKGTADLRNLDDKFPIFKNAQNIRDWVKSLNQSILCNDALAAPRTSSMLSEDIPINRFISAPALFGDMVIGQIVLANGAREYTEEDLIKTERLASLLATTLMNFQYQEKIRRSEYFLKRAQEVSQLGDFSWDMVTGKTIWSDQIFRLLGIDSKEAEPSLNLFLSRLHAADRHIVEDAIQIITQGEEPPSLQFRFLHQDGTVRWGEIVPSIEFSPERKPIRTFSTFQDITSKKQAEELQRKTLKDFENIFYNSFVGIIFINGDRTIQRVNPRLCEIMGFSEDELVGQNTSIYHLSQYYYDEMGRAMKGQFAKSDLLEQEFPLRHKNGKTILCKTIGRILDINDPNSSVIWVIDDITRQRELEEHRDDVERIMRHDLKTPLNGIMGIPQLLALSDNMTDDDLELLKAMEDAGRKMLRMIDMSLDMFKMEVGNYEYYASRVDALAFINQVATHNASRLSAKDMSISITINGNPATSKDSFFIQSNAQLLYTMLANLLINAIEASPHSKEVTLDISELKPARIQIQNNGAVPEQMRSSFFEKYKTFGKKSGTGLGTYSAKLIADTMGYRIQMDTSDVKNITTITIELLTEGIPMHEVQ